MTDRMADALSAISKADVPPGHVDYLSKKRMAEIARAALSDHATIAKHRAVDDLYAALEALVGFIDREGPASMEWKAISEWCDRGRAALAKAREKEVDA